MLRTIGKFFVALLLLLALYLLVLWAEWLPLSKPVGLKAVAIMSTPLPPIATDKNAFSEIWLFPYDISEADKAKVMAADISHYSKFHDDMKYGSSAEGKYPKFDDTENLLCKSKNESCIEKVRSNLDKYDAFFAKNEKLVSKANAFTKFRISRSVFSSNVFTPFPNFTEPFHWQLTTAAYWHVKGKHVDAIDLACRTATSWRGMAENSHGLIDQMIGLAFYANTTGQLSLLLSETSRNIALPSSCSKAYAPVLPKKFPICRSMQLEFQTMLNATDGVERGEVSTSGLADQKKWTDKPKSLWFNKRASKEEFALGYVDQCTDDKEIMDEIGKPKETFWNGMSLIEAGFNPIGGILASITEGTYSDYSKRMKNLSLTQQAMQAVLVERGQKSTAENTKHAWENNKKLRFNVQTEQIEVDLYRNPQENQLLNLPLAGSKLPE